MNFNIFLCIILVLDIVFICFLKICNKIKPRIKFIFYNSTFIKGNQRFILILSVIVVIRIFILEPFYIPSNSMVPTLVSGDFIFVDKNFYGVYFPILNIKIISNNMPCRGDVIVFKHYSGSNYVKRIIGIPGDTIQYKNNFVYVNGVPIKFYFCCYKELFGNKLKSYKEKTLGYTMYGVCKEDPCSITIANYVDITVPQNCYFVLGDNRSNSSDSRSWGFVVSTDIIGKASFIWMSVDVQNFIIRWCRVCNEL